MYETRTRIATGTDRQTPHPDSDWTDEARLRDLHVRRGWNAKDIARHFDVPYHQVRDRLHELEIFVEKRGPCSGPARELWLRGLNGGKEP